MRRIVGVTLLVLVLGSIFFTTAIDLGIFKAIVFWGMAIVISAIILFSIYLISN